MTEIFFGENAKPIEIELDDEVSISTACLIKHVAKSRRGPPPSSSSKILRSTRRTRSMDRISPPRTQTGSPSLVRARTRRSIRKITPADEDISNPADEEIAKVLPTVDISEADTDNIPDIPSRSSVDKPKAAEAEMLTESKDTIKTTDEEKSLHELTKKTVSKKASKAPDTIEGEDALPVEKISNSRTRKTSKDVPIPSRSSVDEPAEIELLTELKEVNHVPQKEKSTTSRKRRAVKKPQEVEDELSPPVIEKRKTRGKEAAKAVNLIDVKDSEKDEMNEGETQVLKRATKTKKDKTELVEKPKTRKTRKAAKDTVSQKQDNLKDESTKDSLNVDAVEQEEIEMVEKPKARKPRTAEKNSVAIDDANSKSTLTVGDSVEMPNISKSPIEKQKKTRSKKPTKKDKHIERQNKLVATVKRETRQRIAEGQACESAPEVIMETVISFLSDLIIIYDSG